MRLSDAELDLLLDIISTHLVRHEDGQDIAQGREQQDVQDLMVMLTEETLARNDLAIAEGGLMVLIDPFSMPKGEA